MQQMLFVFLCVGSFISWEKPFEEDNASTFDPSVVLISLDIQEWYLALKSPVIIDNSGLQLSMSHTKWIKFIITLTGWTKDYRDYYFFIVVSHF